MDAEEGGRPADAGKQDQRARGAPAPKLMAAPALAVHPSADVHEEPEKPGASSPLSSTSSSSGCSQEFVSHEACGREDTLKTAQPPPKRPWLHRWVRHCGSAQQVFLSHLLVALALAAGDVIHAAEVGWGPDAWVAAILFATYAMLSSLLIFSSRCGRRLTCSWPMWPGIVALQWAAIYISSAWRQGLTADAPDQGGRFAALGAFTQVLLVWLYPMGYVASLASSLIALGLLGALSALGSASESSQVSHLLQNGLLLCCVGTACALLSSSECGEACPGAPPLVRSDATARIARAVFLPLLDGCDGDTDGLELQTRHYHLQKLLIRSKGRLENSSIVAPEVSQVLLEVVDTVVKQMGSDSLQTFHGASSEMNHFVEETFNPGLTQADLVAMTSEGHQHRRTGSSSMAMRRRRKPSLSGASRRSLLQEARQPGPRAAPDASGGHRAAEGAEDEGTESLGANGLPPELVMPAEEYDRSKSFIIGVSECLASWVLRWDLAAARLQPDYDNSVMQLMTCFRYIEEIDTPEVSPFEELPTSHLKRLGKWDFDTLHFATTCQHPALVLIGLAGVMPLLDGLDVCKDRVAALLHNVAARYHSSNVYHNSWHGADVFNNVLYFLSMIPAAAADNTSPFPGVERFAALMAAAAHDVGHDGRANRFHIMVSTPLSLLYNDKSVLESMHCAIFFALLQVEASNILIEFDNASKATFRSLVVNMILETDLAVHMQVLTKFRQELLPADAEAADKPRPGVKELSVAHRHMVLSMILKFSDVGPVYLSRKPVYQRSS